jgi:hypothetical protein
MKEIVEFLKRETDILNPEAMAEDLVKAVAMYYTAATCYAKQESIYTATIAKLTQESALSGLNAKEKELIVKGKAAEQKYNLSLSKGILDALYVKIESLRTLISKAKEELKLTK